MRDIDIKETRKYLSENNKVFVAAVKVQCPIYVFHISMMVKDNDPFYPVDWAIMHYVKQQPQTDVDYLSALIGMNSNFVQWRLVHLTQEDASLACNLNGSYFITNKGNRKYFDGERDEVKRDKQLALDGVTLDFLDEKIYAESHVMIRPYKAEFNPHMPLLGDADSNVMALLQKLEGLSSEQKKSLRFDESAHDFSVRNIEPKCLEDVEVVFSYDKNDSTWSRELMFKSQSVRISSMEGILNQFIFYIRDGILCTHQGYSDTSEEITSFYLKEIKMLISKRYEIKDYRNVKDDNIDYNNNPQGEASSYPLTINVTPALFEKADNRRLLLSDAINGEFIMPVSNGTGKKDIQSRSFKGVFIIPIKNSIEKEVDTYLAINKWLEEKGDIDYSFVQSYFSPDEDWRTMFLRLHCYEELEEIDNKRFIKE